jgi:hypothetical protein
METSPIAGFIVYIGQLCRQGTLEIHLSQVPIEIGAYAAETATAEPEGDPEGLSVDEKTKPTNQLLL